MLRYPLKIFTFLIWVSAELLLTAPVFAAENRALAAFEEGTSAFQQGDYEAAVKSFEESRDSGQKGPVVHYNIGVCHYKLGNYLESWSAFRKVADYPLMAPLAYYNLGLVEMARGNGSAADDWFRLTLQHAQDEKLQAMAERMLGAEKPSRRVSSWHGIVLTEAGYDDNVRLRNDLISLPDDLSIDSPVGMIFASIGGPYTRGSGFLFDGSVYLTQYPDADDLDQIDVMAGGRYVWVPADWRIEVGGQAGYSTLGGKGFEEKALLSLQVRKPVLSNTAVDFRYTYEEIRAGDELFALIDGSRQRIRIRTVWRSKGTSLQLSYNFESNDRAGPVVSPDRHRVQARYVYVLEPNWKFQVSASFRRSEYDNLPGTRVEDLTMLGARIGRRIGSSWELYLDYSYGRSDSDDERFSYDRNRAVIGASFVF